MPSGWTASCGMRGSQMCKAKWTYWAMAAESAVQVEHRLNLRQIGKMATRIDCRFLATSDALQWIHHLA